LLEKKTGLDSRGGNSYTNWASITKEQEQFKAKIIHSPCHVVVTMRSKQDYVVETNDKGKPAPKKVGLAPIQREGMEYEFTTVFDISMDHSYHVSKDRTGLFDGRIEKLGEKTGQEIREWLNSGKPEILKDEAPLVDQTDVSLFHKTFINIKEAKNELAATEFWRERNEAEKKALWNMMTLQERGWMKTALDRGKAPKEARV
jgi:hypothetical protein